MASPIDPTLAKSLIKEFQHQNASASGPRLITQDGSFLNGFFLDRKSLESLLHDSNVAGISLQFAKHPDFAGKEGNVFTIVFVGAVPNKDPHATAPYKSHDYYMDKTPTCPPICCDLI
jgi:hypothetical protein